MTIFEALDFRRRMQMHRTGPLVESVKNWWLWLYPWPGRLADQIHSSQNISGGPSIRIGICFLIFRHLFWICSTFFYWVWFSSATSLVGQPVSCPAVDETFDVNAILTHWLDSKDTFRFDRVACATDRLGRDLRVMHVIGSSCHAIRTWFQFCNKLNVFSVQMLTLTTFTVTKAISRRCPARTFGELLSSSSS